MNKVPSNAGLRFVMNGKVWLAVAVLLTAWGCGGGDTVDPTANLDQEQKEIAELVYNLADSTGSIQRFRELYAKDAAPASTDLAKYKDYMFYMRSDPVITGNTATFTAGMEKGMDPTIIEKEWKAVKEADGWRLSSTPVP